MPKKAAELTAIEVKNLSAKGLHFVGGVAGLALQVLPTGGRTWVLRVKVGAKRRDMGLGGFPDVTLAQAREAAREARAKVRQGIDPIEESKAARSALRATQAAALTFMQCAQFYIAAHEAGWKNAKHGQQWRNTLEMYAYPVIGSMLVRDVGLAHILAIVEPIWNTKTETASRVRNRVELVLDWATARAYRDGLNPARWRGHLDKLLPARSKAQKVEHHPALSVEAMPGFMVRLREANGMGARALEFAILTASRSGEVRGATWAEMNLETKVWTVPAARMKAGKEHRVPLSNRAVALLRSLPREVDNELVFPAPRSGQLSDMTLSAVLRRLEVPAVPHGFRSTFRDWAAERTNYPNEVCEMALAHSIGDKTEAAYRRGDLFTKRVNMMEAWSAYCDKPATSLSSVAYLPMTSAA